MTGLSDTDAAAVIAGMKDVETNGLAVAKHVRGEIYEVVAAGDHQTFRVLFAVPSPLSPSLNALKVTRNSRRSSVMPPPSGSGLNGA
jgi:hypothetical protein